MSVFDNIFKINNSNSQIQGLNGGLKALYIYNHYKQSNKSVLVVTYSLYLKCTPVCFSILGSEPFNISTVVLLIVSLCLVLSVKNSYILARHVTETLLILFNINQVFAALAKS